MKRFFLKIFTLPRFLLLLIISAYQKTLSPDHGPLRHVFPFGWCKFNPTCSQYASQSIQKYGVVKGIVKSIWRILRCNPWSQGGQDIP
ncbi:membrane protein insertion efficiency factor YidD [Candidatus Peregrinibacteria bacterium]|nr:membrane protein insertion efficiency factor YidD [Candidatus Peregrinibacteria bacterium]